jgi:hypothetical protein
MQRRVPRTDIKLLLRDGNSGAPRPRSRESQWTVRGDFYTLAGGFGARSPFFGCCFRRERAEGIKVLER